ncbi:MAG TPA: toll/interleukin-1 receptor domain-containing protein [Thermoanaerobaculia bacterium]|nr:toll/interleukin-1 receptor domain-containing protein [Thermoanaerobaculia bacterium]
MPPEQLDVFISYSSEDKELAERIEQELTARQLKVYRDRARLQPGQRFVGELSQAIEASRAVAFLISPAANRSEWVNDEYQLAEVLNHERQGSPLLIPVLIGEAQPPGFLPIHQQVDLRPRADFLAGIDALARAIRGEAAGSAGAEPLPPKLRFLRSFPEGLLPPLYTRLVVELGLPAMARTAESSHILRPIDSDGVELIALDPKYLVSSAAVTIMSAKKLLEALESCFDEEDPFFAIDHIGRGRALLIRDLLTLAAALHPEVDEDRRERYHALARLTLPLLLSEGEVRIGLEISFLLLTRFLPDERDNAIHAQFLLRIGQATAAADLLEIYRGDRLFELAGWSPSERISAALAWTRASKEAGRARVLHAELVASFGSMLELVSQLPAGEERSQLRARILNDRATQLAVFGDPEEWVTAQADLDEALRLTDRLGQLDEWLTVISNQIAFTLDRLDRKSAPPADLFERMNQADERLLQVGADATFFYLYQRARLLRRANRLSEAEQAYREATVAATADGLSHRAAQAKLWSLRLQKQLEQLSEDDFLTGLNDCITILDRSLGDDWTLNSLREALMELGRLLLNRHNSEGAWDAGVRAFAVAIGRPTNDSALQSTHWRDILAFIVKVPTNATQRDQFLAKYSTRLRQLLRQKPDRLPMTWQALGEAVQ